MTSHKSTVITAINNKEYLLPFWLEHHYPLFDHGIIIDYHSTDDSVNIIRALCPDWDIIHKTDESINDEKIKEDVKKVMNNDRMMFLYITEFFITTKNHITDYSGKDIPSFIGYSDRQHFYPQNLKEFFEEMNILHFEQNIGHDDFIIDCSYYPLNPFMNKRAQIKKINPDKKDMIRLNHIIKLNKKSLDIYIYYSNLIGRAVWGNDEILLQKDVDLLRHTDFHMTGYHIFDINLIIHQQLLDFFQKKINSILSKNIQLEKYHESVQEHEHSLILNSMPFKSYDMLETSQSIEKFVSLILNEDVKIFNQDIWFRICRPSVISNTDYNPCHRDIYLEFYKNVVNIYIPLAGSNHLSSLYLQPGSHLWKESETMITKGGAYFKHQDKKYSVDAIVASKTPLQMIRPDPKIGQMMIFSPYLIHGCSNNDNKDTTRISIEIRFIRNDENKTKQETAYKTFLQNRKWR